MINRKFLIAALVVISGCVKKEVAPTIEFAAQTSISPLAEIADSIRLLPLDSDSSHLLGARTMLTLAGDDYILSDAENVNVYLYHQDGSYGATIGIHGNGPQEYLSVSAVQSKGDTVAVFSWPSKLFLFDKTGMYISQEEFEDLGIQSHMAGEEVLTYYGFGSGRNGRLGKFDRTRKLQSFLPSKEQVLHISPMYPIFHEFGGKVFLTDGYSEIVKVYEDGVVSDWISFDFGKYAIPESFYTQDDAMDAAKLLLSRDFALIDCYQESEDWKFVDVMVQKQPMPEKYYGLCKEDAWTWFSGGKLGEDIFADAPRILSGNCLYCLLDPSLKDTYPKELREKTVNDDILANLAEDDNFVIAKIYLD